jgi:ribosomal protein L29
MALKVAQLREESAGRLREILAETKDQLFKYRLRIASGEGANPHEARGMRRQVARIETLLRAVELVAAKAGIDEEAAREQLTKSGWDIAKSVAAAKAAAVQA